MADNIEEMNKDELEEVARKFGKEIDKRRKLEDIRKDVLELVPKDKQNAEVKEKTNPENMVAMYLKHPVTGFVFNATDILMARGDLIKCDKDGNEF